MHIHAGWPASGGLLIKLTRLDAPCDEHGQYRSDKCEENTKNDPADATDDQASKDNHCYLPCGNAALQDNIVNDQTCRNSEEDA